MGCCHGKVRDLEPTDNAPTQRENSKNKKTDQPDGTVKVPSELNYNYDAYSRQSSKTPRSTKKPRQKNYRKRRGGQFKSYDSNPEKVYNTDPAYLPAIKHHPNQLSLTPRLDSYTPRDKWLATTTRSQTTIPEESDRRVVQSARSLNGTTTSPYHTGRRSKLEQSSTLSNASCQSSKEATPCQTPVLHRAEEPDADQDTSTLQGSVQRSITHIGFDLRTGIDSPAKRQERALMKLIATSYRYRRLHPAGYGLKQRKAKMQERLKSQGYVRPESRERGKTPVRQNTQTNTPLSEGGQRPKSSDPG